jgi:hypothetical protein
MTMTNRIGTERRTDNTMTMTNRIGTERRIDNTMTMTNRIGTKRQIMVFHRKLKSCVISVFILAYP